MLDGLFASMALPSPESKTHFLMDGDMQYEKLIKDLYGETSISYGRVIKVKKENKVVEIILETVLGDTRDHKISTSVVEGYNNEIPQLLTFFVRKKQHFPNQLSLTGRE
jgi:hypothetical protein